MTPPAYHAEQPTPEHRLVDCFDAINGLFTMLEDAYPLKFKRAFPSDDDVKRAKRVWASSLREFSPARIANAGRRALDTTKFFPDLSDIRRLCRLNYSEAGLKEPQQAYIEACNAPVQTRDYHWSHIAVYLAARETGWLELRSEEQRVIFPRFERNYEILCNRVLDGEDLDATIFKGISYQRNDEHVQQAQAAAEQQQRHQLQAQGIDPDDAAAARAKLRAMFGGLQS